jgi:oligoribonuclease
MPEFMEHLHYRIVDVSSVKELCKRWFPKEFSQIPSKKLTHHALDDSESEVGSQVSGEKRSHE